MEPGRRVSVLVCVVYIGRITTVQMTREESLLLFKLMSESSRSSKKEAINYNNENTGSIINIHNFKQDPKGIRPSEAQ